MGQRLVKRAARGNAPGTPGCFGSGTLVALLLVVLSATAPARAAEISLSNKPGCLFELTGSIRAGDAGNFARMAAQHWQGIPAGHTEDNADRALCLDSPGGMFMEGNALATEVHERAIATRVGPGADCLSACALVFMAGRVRGAENDGKRRILHVTGRVGLHAPYVAMDANREYSGEAVNAFVPALTGLIADFIRHAAFRSAYQERPSVSLGLLAEMMATPQDSMFMIDSVEKAARWGVDLDGIRATHRYSSGDYAQLCVNQLAWIYDSGAARLTAADLSALRIETTRKTLMGGPTNMIVITEMGLADRVCEIEVAANADRGTGLCLSDGYTGVGLGDCDDPTIPFSVWFPWWHAMPPDMPLEALR